MASHQQSLMINKKNEPIRSFNSQPSNENNPQHQAKKPLNFQKAMSDFSIMFPEIERDVIETVLRANNGVVQPTIDQLLVLQESASIESGKTMQENSPTELPSYEESSLGKSTEEAPPAYADVWRDNTVTRPSPSPVTHNRTFDNNFQEMNNSFFTNFSRWKAPLVGKLPDDFLKLETVLYSPVTSSTRVGNEGTVNKGKLNKGRDADDFMTEDELEQFMEDEKLAMFLQNEEFLRELRRNKEFVNSLEADHKLATGSGASSIQPNAESYTSGGARPRTTPGQEDAAFKMKLKHMGKSTRKRFGKMAKKFSRNKNAPSKVIFASESTFNLLEEESDDQPITGLDGVQEDESDEELNNSFSSGIQSTNNNTKYNTSFTGVPSTGRRLPQPPTQQSQSARNENLNNEPIVFYSEDNEFQLKYDS